MESTTIATDIKDFFLQLNDSTCRPTHRCLSTIILTILYPYAAIDCAKKRGTNNMFLAIAGLSWITPVSEGDGL